MKTQDPEDENSCDEHNDDKASVKRFRAFMRDLQPGNTDGTISIRSLEGIIGKAIEGTELRTLLNPDLINQISTEVELDEETDELNTNIFSELGVDPAKIKEVDFAQNITLVRNEAMAPPTLSPSHAAARNVEPALRFGPFRDRLRRDYFIGLLQPVQKITVKPSATAAPLLLATKAQLPMSLGATINLRKGTIWVRAKAFDASAPSNGYIGLKIQKGTLEFSATPSRDEDDIILATGDQRLSLSVELEQNASSSKRITALPPKKLNIKFSSGEAVVGDFQGTATIDSTAFEFEGNRSTRHDDRRERIVFGCAISPIRLDTADLKDAGANFEGQTELSKAGWGVPITIPSDPAELGEAAGQQVWIAELFGEFTAYWQGGPADPITVKEAFLVIQEDAFAIDVVVASPDATGDRHRFNLWRLPESAHRQRLDVHLEETFEAHFGWSGVTGSFVVFDGVSPFLFDRPVTAIGRAASIGEAVVTVYISGDLDAQSLYIYPRVDVDPVDSAKAQRQMLVLENAYLATDTLIFGGLVSKLRNGTDAFDGFAGFIIPVFGWIPILPDPYVDNLCIEQKTFSGRKASSHLLGLFAWGDGGAAFEFYGLIESLSASLCTASNGGSGPMRVSDGDPRYDGQTQQGARIPQYMFRRWDVAAMVAGSQYEETGPPPQGIPGKASLKGQERFHDAERKAGLRTSGPMLLDVSTARHQIGVQLIQDTRKQYTNIAPTSGGRYVIYQSRLGAALSALRVFALPQIQWEPVRTLEKDQDPATLGVFPTPLASPDDGGATVIGSNSASLAPVIPDLTLNEVLRAFDGGEPFGVVTTLPFGMKTLFRVRSDATVARLADTAEYVRPRFDTPNALAGGLQLSIRSEGGASRPGRESPSFEGLAVQTLNGVNLATGAPLNISVLGATAGSDGSVESLFNTEFSVDRPRVPLTRYDISGYGASTFSDWANPKGSFAETTRAQFQVMVGRTALEVVKIASVIYPWGIRATRSVTIERKGGGGVLRRDSGWQAQSSGVFDFTTDTEPDQPFKIHPGLIRGVFNATRIRPLANDGIDLPDGGKVLPMAFDAEVELDGRVGGGLTPARGLVGYLHLEPTGAPISETALATLIAHQGAIGGPVDSDIDVANSGFKVRALRIEIDVASSPDGIKLVGAVRTTPRFGAAGSWSVARASSPGRPGPYDATAVIDGAPIIREGEAQPSPDGTIRAPMTGPYRFADARDLFAGASPQNDYGFIQSDTTHRFLFRRPKIEPNTPCITSDLSPVFVDFFAATSSKGLFPPVANGIELTDKSYQLDVDADTGFLALTPNVDLASPRGDLFMSDSATDQFRIAYGDSNLRFSLSPTDWSLDFSRVELWTDTSDWPELSGTRITLRGGVGRRAELDKIETLMSPVLEEMFSILPFMDNRGVHGPVDLGATNLKAALKLSLGIDTILEDPTGYVAIRLFVLFEIGVVLDGNDVFLGGKTGFEARFSIPIDPYPVAVIFGWVITLGGKVFLAGPDAGKSKGLLEFRVYVGLAFGEKLGPFEATVAAGVGLFIVDGSETGLGGFIFLEIKAKIPPIVAIKVFGEFACLQITKDGDKYQRWSGQVGINVSIFMIISIKFTADVSDEKKI